MCVFYKMKDYNEEDAHLQYSKISDQITDSKKTKLHNEVEVTQRIIAALTNVCSNSQPNINAR